ncbi:glycerophosphoryl diester phosphodiesterase [Nocardioides albertanoniae]|uniref:Glycerophosphoryl diester phosphodiesterase n=1 Tax=Nocardioides albertanoniae TaxID=1175486 RepID=A0A543A0R9_9ACTN|nr:glycerophosphodiester phosphodiesterase family protein [Nocardioides albertanoniae]TQL66188.1 glycerophosphoryl diester phosphodiesterase [Nocardioides albertanoniae]
MRPQVVAHRGASHDIAEHTLAAYVAALDAGADALECDVRLTMDGHLVCVHDRHLRRIGAQGLVSEMTLAELQAIDFAAWKGDVRSGVTVDPDPDMRGVLTLHRLLRTVHDYDRHVEVAIETKHPTRYGGLTEGRLVDVLGDFGWAGPGGPVRVMSFSFTALQRVERLAPGVPLVQLVDRAANWSLLRHVIGEDWWLGAGIDMLTAHPKLARRLAQKGRNLHVYTVNTEEQLKLCLDLQVQSLITDRPGFLLGLLGR